MKRLAVMTVGLTLAAVPALFGLTGNPALSHSVPVRVPAGVSRVAAGTLHVEDAASRKVPTSNESTASPSHGISGRGTSGKGGNSGPGRGAESHRSGGTASAGEGAHRRGGDASSSPTSHASSSPTSSAESTSAHRGGRSVPQVKGKSAGSGSDGGSGSSGKGVSGGGSGGGG